jgi:hypothetical protein
LGGNLKQIRELLKFNARCIKDQLGMSPLDYARHLANSKKYSSILKKPCDEESQKHPLSTQSPTGSLPDAKRN